MRDERGDLRRLERAECGERSEAPRLEERHGAGRTDRDRGVAARCDGQRIAEVYTPQDPSPVRAERHGEHLVRPLGGDDGDRMAGERRAARRRGKEREAGEREGEQPAHACDTPGRCRAVPGELPFPRPGRGAAWLARWSGGPKVAGSNPAAPIHSIRVGQLATRQPTSRARRRRLCADPRRDWARR